MLILPDAHVGCVLVRVQHLTLEGLNPACDVVLSPVDGLKSVRGALKCDIGSVLPGMVIAQVARFCGIEGSQIQVTMKPRYGDPNFQENFTNQIRNGDECIGYMMYTQTDQNHSIQAYTNHIFFCI